MPGNIPDQLLEIAERLAATQGIAAMSLRAVQIESGQRNKSVVQYYFGSREGLIRAVMDARMGPINSQRLALLEDLESTPGIRALVEAFVRPLAEATILKEKSYWARFLLHASFDRDFRNLVRKSFTASSFRAVRNGIISRLENVPRPARTDRVDLMVVCVLAGLAGAEWAREEGRMGPRHAARLSADLIDMCCGLLSAPASWSPTEQATQPQG